MIRYFYLCNWHFLSREVFQKLSDTHMLHSGRISAHSARFQPDSSPKLQNQNFDPATSPHLSTCFLKNTLLVRDRAPLTRVSQMRYDIPHLPNPSLGGSISHPNPVYGGLAFPRKVRISCQHARRGFFFSQKLRISDLGNHFPSKVTESDGRVAKN